MPFHSSYFLFSRSYGSHNRLAHKILKTQQAGMMHDEKCRWAIWEAWRRSQSDLQQVVHAEPGDVLLMHQYLAHSSSDNHSKVPRIAFNIRARWKPNQVDL